MVLLRSVRAVSKAVVERCIAEAAFITGSRDVQSFQEKISGTDRHIQMGAIGEFIVGVKQGIARKGCADDIRDKFGEKETSVLPVKIVSPAKIRRVFALESNQPLQQK